MTTRERAEHLFNESNAVVERALEAHAAEAVSERDTVWREAVQAIGDEYGVLKYRIWDKIFAEVERRTGATP